MLTSVLSRYMPDLSGWNAGVAESPEKQLSVYLNRRELQRMQMTPPSSDPKLFLQQHERQVQLAFMAAEEANGGFDFFM